MPLHIKRLILAFAVFIVLFLVLQQILKPASFGELGHYRTKAIDENAAKELRYAGTRNCTSCHDSIRVTKAGGFHDMVNCEVCHGPGLKHSLHAGRFQDKPLPDSLLLEKPAERKDCAVCHEINAARKKILYDTVDNTLVKQVNTMEHNLISRKTKQERKCVQCHNPHQP